jgi:tetratricopeptide (TPR) repeat protein
MAIKVLPAVCLGVVLSAGCASIDKYVEEGRLADGESYCREQSGGSARTCWRKLADASEKSGKHSSAAGDYERAGPEYSSLAEGCWLKAAEASEKSGEYSSAAGYYEKAGPKYSSLAEGCWLKAAEVALSNRSYESALVGFRKAKCRDGLKRVADAYVLRGKYLQYLKAMSIYREAGDAAGIEKCQKLAGGTPADSAWFGKEEQSSDDVGIITFKVSNGGSTITDMELSIPTGFGSARRPGAVVAVPQVAIVDGQFSYQKKVGAESVIVTGRFNSPVEAEGEATFAIVKEDYAVSRGRGSAEYGRLEYRARRELVSGGMNWTASAVVPR